MPKQRSNFTFADHDGEISRVSIWNGAVTAASIAGFLTEFGQMRDAVADLSIGTLRQEEWVGDTTRVSNLLPTDPNAQRERKWRVVYEGDTNKRLYEIEIPAAKVEWDDDADPMTADVSLLLSGTNKADLTQTPWATFVTRFESFARTPIDDTETVTIVSAELVGRNI